MSGPCTPTSPHINAFFTPLSPVLIHQITTQQTAKYHHCHLRSHSAHLARSQSSGGSPLNPHMCWKCLSRLCSCSHLVVERYATRAIQDAHLRFWIQILSQSLWCISGRLREYLELPTGADKDGLMALANKDRDPVRHKTKQEHHPSTLLVLCWLFGISLTREMRPLTRSL